MAGSFKFPLLAPVVCLPPDFLNADGRLSPGLCKWKEKKNSTLLWEAAAQCKGGRRGVRYPSNHGNSTERIISCPHVIFTTRKGWSVCQRGMKTVLTCFLYISLHLQYFQNGKKTQNLHEDLYFTQLLIRDSAWGGGTFWEFRYTQWKHQQQVKRES